jgi:hypothetical protein
MMSALPQAIGHRAARTPSPKSAEMIAWGAPNTTCADGGNTPLEKPAGGNRGPHQCFVKLNLMVSAECDPTSASHAFGVLVNSLWSFPVLNTLVKVNADVNTDGHQSSKTSGRAHAPNGPDPLRQLFACPWNSSSGGPATVSDVEPDRLP